MKKVWYATVPLIFLLTSASAAWGGDRDFDAIVRAIQTHYGTAPTHIPLMGLARFVVKTAHPEGVSGFRIAIFENLKNDGEEDANRDELMRGISNSRLRPLVQVQSRKEGESTYIYLGDAGKSTEVLIATFERNEATVVDAKVSMDVLARALKDPGHMGSMLGSANSGE